MATSALILRPLGEFSLDVLDRFVEHLVAKFSLLFVGFRFLSRRSYDVSFTPGFVIVPTLLVGALDLLPALADPSGRLRLGVTEHVRVPANELGVHRARDVGDG